VHAHDSYDHDNVQTRPDLDDLRDVHDLPDHDEGDHDEGYAAADGQAGDEPDRGDAHDRFDAYDRYASYDTDDGPTATRIRRLRSDTDPAPRARGRMTEEARERLARDREAVATAEGPPTGFRWSTWEDVGARGPEPYPDWLVTELAATDTELGILKTGKEADVYLIERGVPDTDWACLLASKQYRTGDHRLFHRDAGYLEGRRARKSREQRAITNRSSYGRNLIAQQWAIAEFAALGELWAAGAPVPYPVQHLGTELLLEFIGSPDGTAAPRLAQLRPEPDELDDLWRQLLDALVILARRGHTHGDLSAFNILVHDGTLVLIDLPQLVDIVTNPQGRRYLERDVHRICEWFVARGHPAHVADTSHVVSLLLGEAGIG
jgi:RIO kinase 1